MASPGGVAELAITDVPEPSASAGNVRVRVRHAAVNPADWKVLGGGFVASILHGRQSPVVVGYDFEGVVDQVGAGVAGLVVGDRVAGFLPYTRATRRGAFAEWVVATPEMVTTIPETMDGKVAAAFPTGGATVLQMIRDLGKLPSGGSILVVGAAGGVGTMALGVGHALGAKVTAVCSTGAVELVRSLGADAVIDRTQTDPLRASGTWDLVLDVAAAWSFASCRHLLTPTGAYVTTLPGPGVFWGKALTLFGQQRSEFVTVQNRSSDLVQLRDWVLAGMQVPIDSTWPVRELRGALERQQRGGMKGKILVEVEGGW